MSNYSSWHNKTLVALCMEALVLMMGMGFLSPVLPKFIQALGVEPAQLGAMVALVITAYGIARVMMDLARWQTSSTLGTKASFLSSVAF
jgi:DHA1 family multidrug resistance protein-like MFS transporter